MQNQVLENVHFDSISEHNPVFFAIYSVGSIHNFTVINLCDVQQLSVFFELPLSPAVVHPILVSYGWDEDKGFIHIQIDSCNVAMREVDLKSVVDHVQCNG